MPEQRRPRIGVVFRGTTNGAGLDPALSPRLVPIAAALTDHRLEVIPVPHIEGHEARVAADLTDVDGALVWADPVSDTGDRHALDRVLRQAARTGVWVSAHPDTVDRLGTKEVLVATRGLSWGSDVYLYRTAEQFAAEFPARLAADGVRVLKGTRGNGGRTVWKVRLPAGPSTTPAGPAEPVVVQHARVRDGSSSVMSLGSLMETCASTFEGWEGTAGLVDQEFVGGITRGMVRCYLVGPAVVGFARQYPTGAVPDGPLQVSEGTGPSALDVMGLPSPKTMYAASEPAYAGLRELLEDQWVPATVAAVGLATDDLPALWDIDLMIVDPGRDDTGRDGTGRAGRSRYALCEINVSSVIPFPPEAPDRVAAHVAARFLPEVEVDRPPRA